MSDELIKSSDFQSIELAISVENTTSRTKIGADKGVRLIEFLEHGFTLEVPKATCAQGHSLTVEFKRRDIEEDGGTSVTGKVEKLARSGGIKSKAPSKPKDEAGDEPEMFRAEVTLVQFDETEWTAFKNLFSSRQEEIEKFLAAVRGY